MATSRETPATKVFPSQVGQCKRLKIFNCGGYWLDAGELAQIRDERSEAALTEPAGGANVSADFIRYLYRLQSEKRG